MMIKRIIIAAHLYLDRVVEGLEDANTLGAQLQVHQPLHTQEDAMVLQRLLGHQRNDAGHRLLHTPSATDTTKYPTKQI